MPQAPPSPAVAGRLTGTSSAAAMIRWPVSPPRKKPPWPRISSIATPSSRVRMSRPLRIAQSEAKQHRPHEVREGERAVRAAGEQRSALGEAGLVLARDVVDREQAARVGVPREGERQEAPVELVGPRRVTERAGDLPEDAPSRRRGPTTRCSSGPSPRDCRRAWRRGRSRGGGARGGRSSTTIANTEVPAETLPERGRTAFVATIPVPASPSGGQSGIAGARSARSGRAAARHPR